MHEIPISIHEEFINNSETGIIIFDSSGYIININNAAREFFNSDAVINSSLKLDDLIGKTCYAELQESINLLTDKTNKNNKTGKLLILTQNKKGGLLVLSLQLNNHFYFEERLLFAAIISDETKAWKDKKELLESKERFKKVFHENSIPQIIIRTTDKVITDVNQRFLQLSGYELQELLGKNIRDTGLQTTAIPKNKPPRLKHVKNKLHEFESAQKLKNGKTIYVLQSRVPIQINEIPHELWSIVDITERKEAENHLKLLNEELELKIQKRIKDLTKLLEREKNMNDLKSRFVSMASHEFRTPLTTILVSAGLLKSHLERNTPEKCGKHIDRIQTSVKLLTEILEEFLSLDKIEQGEVKSHISEVDLKEFSESILNETESTLKKDQVIEYTHEGSLLIKQDKKILQKTILNLLSNAVKYSAPGKKIKWTTKVQKDKLVFIVADEGIGIPIEDQPYIFSRFFRAKNAEITEGTGIGLNIVKKYMELMNGKISFKSAENEGSAFTAEFPIIK